MNSARRKLLVGTGASIALLVIGWRSNWAGWMDARSQSAEKYAGLRQRIADQYADFDVVVDDGWIVSRSEKELRSNGDLG
jgi:hypothetical protein